MLLGLVTVGSLSQRCRHGDDRRVMVEHRLHGAILPSVTAAGLNRRPSVRSLSTCAGARIVASKLPSVRPCSVTQLAHTSGEQFRAQGSAARGVEAEHETIRGNDGSTDGCPSIHLGKVLSE